MNANVFGGRRGVSPVLATILLVAVTLVLAVSTAFFCTSTVGAYTGFEEIEVWTVKVTPVTNLKGATQNLFKGSGWNVSITLRNTGTKQGTITSLLLNGRPLDAYDRVAIFDGTRYVQQGAVALSIPGGSSRTIFLAIKNGNDAGSGIVFSPGLRLDVTLQSESGLTYQRLITLP